MLAKLRLPPGVLRPGTSPYDAQGRWYDATLVRFGEDGFPRPVGGWAKLQTSAPADVTAGEAVRGMVAWRSNDGVPHLAFGGPTKLYHFSSGALTDITPADLDTGHTDAAEVSGGLYGYGAYGTGDYGTGDTTQTRIREAQVWQLDTFGEDLVALAYSDGRLFHWDRSAGGAAAEIAGAPTECGGLVVTPERFLVALGAGGDGRRIAWPSQETLTDWMPGVNNTAGGLYLDDQGRALAGRRGQKETLIWTDTSLHVLRYVGGTLIYGLRRVATGCGAASRQAMAVLGGRAYWMGRDRFYVYDGASVNQVPCGLARHVFDDLNEDQISKVVAVVDSDQGEVTWFYPSASSTENDRYVTYSEALREWWPGELERTAGVDRGAWELPHRADASGQVYQHETGSSWLDTDGATALTPRVESGPVEIRDGNQVMRVQRIVPSEKKLGGATLRMYGQNWPTDAETAHGPWAAAQPTDVRFSARTVRLRADFSAATDRFGVPRLDVVPGGRR